jgi:F0F1-type ATP synthase membrane subunit c/vacuolar-type H+-ATPase subunit K
VRQEALTKPDLLAAHLFQLRIVIGALVAGVVIFAAIAIFLAGKEGLGGTDQDESLAHLLLLVLALLGLGQVAAYPLVRRALVAKLRAEWKSNVAAAAEDARCLTQFQSLTIIAAGMTEGFAFFATVIYLLTAHPAALLGSVIGLLTLFRLIPTSSTFARFAAEVSGPA